MSSEAPRMLPQYPVYVPSRSRYDTGLTVKWLTRDEVPFFLVVEPSQQFHYRAAFPRANVLVLPEDDYTLMGARNWIMAHSLQEVGAERHWQLDDNIRGSFYWYKQKRIPCRGGIALRAVEDFTDRYENVAISGMNYLMFGTGRQNPVLLNHHVYSASLINNAIEQRWRLIYNDDTDMCLQVLAAGWCTLLFNTFLVEKIWTMQVRGGNTEQLYWGDGRANMARALERMWPGVVEVKRRFNRPQHYIKDSWKRFDTPLKLKEGVDLDELARRGNPYPLQLTARKEVRSPRLQRMLEEAER